MNKVKKSSSLLFAALVIVAFIISLIPIIHWPFSWMMTFFHEISHGIAALLTGGSVEKINLNLRGSGLCTTIGGVRFVVLLSGYMGAVIWGGCIYIMADKLNKKHTDVMALALSGLVILVAVFWGRDIITLAIMTVLATVFLAVIRLQNYGFVKLAIKFIGVYILLDAVKAPLYLIDGRHYGDGAKLSDLTFIPEIIWALIWLGFGILGLVFLWQSHGVTDKNA